MKAAKTAAILAFLGFTATASAQKVPPPADHNALAAYFIYLDVDYVSFPNGTNNSAICPSVRAIRSKCYAEGVAKNLYAAEQQCLCSQDTAYNVVQCFAEQYSQMPSGPDRDNYYTQFLAYTYDCFCGVTGYDVTYNVSMNPPQPFITGFTGDPIVPPTAGCVKQQTLPQPCPQPPNNVPPPPPPPPPPCPAGYQRCNGACVQVCPPVKVCPYPQKLDKSGNCYCPWPLRTDSQGRCYTPNFCADLQDQSHAQSIIGCQGGYCTCAAGYEFYPPGVYYKNAQACCQICPKGYRRTGKCTCAPFCTAPRIVDYNGNCICPTDYGYVEVNGVCALKACPTNQERNYYGQCRCNFPNYIDSRNGNCVRPGCGGYNPVCYPNAQFLAVTANSTLTVSTVTPNYTSPTVNTDYATGQYTNTQTATLDTAAPPIFTTPAANVTIPADVNTTNLTTSTSMMSASSMAMNITTTIRVNSTSTAPALGSSSSSGLIPPTLGSSSRASQSSQTVAPPVVSSSAAPVSTPSVVVATSAAPATSAAAPPASSNPVVRSSAGPVVRVRGTWNRW